MRTTKGRKIAMVAGCLVVVVLPLLAWTCWDEILFWIRFEGLGKNAEGYPEFRHRRTGIVMVHLPGGVFMMGSAETEFGSWPSEGPVHEVTLSPFLLAKYEVTQAEWQKIMRDNPSRFKGPRLPVENVSWEDSQEFCTRTGLSLPSEAQWEYGCRGGASTAFALGRTLSPDEANFEHPGRSLPSRMTVPVDSFKPNRFGLHNMHGNVFEWCEDVYDASFYSRPEARGPDPILTSGSTSRVFRGGAWGYRAISCRSAFRGQYPSSYRRDHVGFRPCSGPPP